jgi:holo-[acyl-carrier protein] synthase
VEIRIKNDTMIFGIGSDIVQVSRIARVAGKYGNRFLRRIYSDKEILEYNKRQTMNGMKEMEFLAGRYHAPSSLQ